MRQSSLWSPPPPPPRNHRQSLLRRVCCPLFAQSFTFVNFTSMCLYAGCYKWTQKPYLTLSHMSRLLSPRQLRKNFLRISGLCKQRHYAMQPHLIKLVMKLFKIYLITTFTRQSPSLHVSHSNKPSQQR